MDPTTRFTTKGEINVNAKPFISSEHNRTYKQLAVLERLYVRMTGRNHRVPLWGLKNITGVKRALKQRYRGPENRAKIQRIVNAHTGMRHNFGSELLKKLPKDRGTTRRPTKPRRRSTKPRGRSGTRVVRGTGGRYKRTAKGTIRRSARATFDEGDRLGTRHFYNSKMHYLRLRSNGSPYWALR